VRWQKDELMERKIGEMAETIRQKIEYSPFKNIYWFSRHLLNTDQYGALGKSKETQMLHAINSIENLMIQNSFTDKEKLSICKGILANEIKSMNTAKTKTAVLASNLIDKLNEGGLTFYIGTDPTADSMHIGHYSSFLISKRLAKHGHHPILLVGGATGLIGDPKPNAERPMITKEEVEHNIQGLKKQAEDIFGFDVVNNYDWTKEINVLDFLRDYGKFFNINYMLAKDKVKSRLETGITYAEFSYMILQALDFMYLFENRNCTLQVAGSDQWGNITSGIELIRKKLDKEAYGMVMPLVTDSTGKKFGKTEGNALWL